LINIPQPFLLDPIFWLRGKKNIKHLTKTRIDINNCKRLNKLIGPSFIYILLQKVLYLMPSSVFFPVVKGDKRRRSE
jgi:hypothetical protein